MAGIDKINHQILQVLESDGRISNTELAARVGLSPSACLRRVQELERSGIIKGYRGVIDRKVLGGAVTVFVMVGLTEVREVHNITGSVEYLLRVEVESLERYKEFHANTLGVVPQVSSITSHIALASPKDLRGCVHWLMGCAIPGFFVNSVRTVPL